jgi:hypothetical protein
MFWLFLTVYFGLPGIIVGAWAIQSIRRRCRAGILKNRQLNLCKRGE